MTIEELYQRIGQLAQENCPELYGKALVYAEVEQGAIESGVLYERGKDRVITFRYCSDELENSLYELWELWQESPGNVPWCGLNYLVQDNKMQIDLSYPEQWVKGEGIFDRRPRMVLNYFGGGPVDFSMPGN